MKQKKTDENTQAKPADELRSQAEVIARENAILSPKHFEELTPNEVRQALYELRVHQVELEMQNDELRRAQAELDATRERYFDLYDMAPVGYCTISEQGLIIEANLTVANLLGVTRSDLTGQPMTRFIHKEEQDIFYIHRKQLFDTDMPQAFELRMVKDNGSDFWARLEAATVQEACGTPVCRVVISNINEYKRGEAALKESELKYRSLIESSSDAIFCVDEKGEYKFTNQIFASTFGKTADYFIGKTFWDIYPKKHADMRYEVTKRVFQTGTSESVEVEVPLPDKTLYFYATANPIKDETGRVILTLTHATDITERKKAEEALIKATYRLDLAQTVAGTGIWDWDIVSGHIEWTRQIFALFGLDRTKTTASFEAWKGCLHPEDVEIAGLRIEQALKEKKDLNSDYRVVLPDGRIRWINAVGKGEYDNHGQPVRMIGICIDITERKLFEELLLSSQHRLSDIIEFLPDATLVIDKEGKVIAWNQAIETMTGVKKADMIGKGDYEYALPFYGERRPILIDLALHPESEREKSYTHIQRLGDILFGEAYTPGLMGGKIHLSATASVLRDAGGEIVAAIECIRDDTQRRKAQEELKSAEERYRSIFENAQEGIYRSTPAGRIIMANKAMANMFGYKTPEELMTNVTDVARQFYVNPEERTKLMEIIEEQGSLVNHETQFHRTDGSVFWVSMTMQGVRDEKGQILYYEGIDEDITDRKEIDERMRKSLVATIQAIAVIVETRDPYTAGHQRRVADLARAIATELKLSANRIDGIRMASSIHDLGKISVPAEILSNPKKLSVLEFSLIKIHAQSGYDILKDIEFPWPVARMIREHHERMDGTGYPQGLIGEEILLESRILAVADVVEAMASHRPYRPAIGLDAALAEMENNKGMLYDVDVVDACLRLFREKGYQLQDA